MGLVKEGGGREGGMAGIVHSRPALMQVDTLGLEPRASRMLSGCDTTTPCAHECTRTHGHAPNPAQPHASSNVLC